MSINEKKKQEFIDKLKCVACNSKNVYPEPYKYKQVEKIKILARIRKNSTLVFTLDLPICIVCKKKFFKWRFYNYPSILIFVLGVLTIVIGILFLIFHQIFGERGVPLISFGFVFVIIGLVVRYIIGKIDSNPRNHFFYDFINTDFYVKPEGESNWILYKLWLKNFLGK
ncbi:MAG: hypothetical protein JSV23_03865 [Promethearchaeota archaeon]|nr:MAG: hypothetical protein JSV23_03865 [Candidatus Lokiarchaeota archaeon]